MYARKLTVAMVLGWNEEISGQLSGPAWAI